MRKDEKKNETEDVLNMLIEGEELLIDFCLANEVEVKADTLAKALGEVDGYKKSAEEWAEERRRKAQKK